MPLVLAAYLAHAAGLLLGFGGVLGPALWGAAIALAAAFSGGRARSAALALLVAGGALLAAATARRDAACRADLLERRRWIVRLDADAAPGGTVRGTVAGRCALPVLAVVARGRGAAGAVVEMEGRAAPRGEGIFVQRGVLRQRGEARGLPAARAAAGRAIDEIFGGDAALARALLVADTRGLDPALRERFAAAGLVHVLSISGLHVAIVAEAVRLMLLATRLPRRRAEIAALSVTAGYVLLLGAPAPALRAAVMLGATAAARILQRPSSPWAGLALGALVPLLHDPRTVLDLGYQLSVVGVAALAAASALWRRRLAGRLDGWRAVVARELVASTAATIVTTPLVAWRIGQVSLVAPLANLAAGPIVAILQPTLFLALVLAPLRPVARYVAGAAHPMLAALDAVAGAAAAVPYASLIVAPTPLAAVLGLVVVAFLVVACELEWPGRAIVGAALALAGLVWLPLAARGSGHAELHVIDVGQGDAVALRTPAGRWVLVDAGRLWRTGDAGRTTIAPYIRRRGGDVVAFVLSHPHADHVGGAASALRLLRPSLYLDPGFPGGGEAYRRSLEAAGAAGIPWRRVHPGDSLVVDGVTLTLLAPDSAWTSALADPNEASTVVMARYGTVRFLLTGDAERGEEAWLLGQGAPLGAQVLKVAHHGSSTSSTPEFLDAVAPCVALVSVGAGNTYGHPDPEVVASLAERGAIVLRTDQLGSLVTRTDGRTLTLEADGESWTPSLPCSRP